MKYRWAIAPSQPALAQLLAKALKISPLLARAAIHPEFILAAKLCCL